MYGELPTQAQLDRWTHEITHHTLPHENVKTFLDGFRYDAHPVLEKVLNVLFILHADHEQNCSTSTMRNIGSAHSDPDSAVAGAAAALYGPLHGGANEAVLRMLAEIGSV